MTEKKIKNNTTVNRMRKLPEFRGFTVDVRLRQFRKGSPETGMEFTDFSSPQGDDLLEEYIGTLDKNSAEFKEIAAYIFTR